MAQSLKGLELVTTSGSSQLFTQVLVEGVQYYLTCSKACWYKVTTGAGSASAATGSQYLPADTPVPISRESSTLTRVAVIQSAEAGAAVLSEAVAGR